MVFTEELSYSYTAKDIIYNLNGTRINGNAQKGIIIKNGDKVLVK